MLNSLFNRKKSQEVDHWNCFYQSVAIAENNWRVGEIIKPTSSIIPITDIEFRETDKTARHQVGMHATMGFLLLKESVRNFLRLTGTEIWTAIDAEALAHKIYDDEDSRQKYIAEKNATSAMLIYSSPLIGHKPLIFLPYRTIQQTRDHSAPRQYHYGGISHEAGHLISKYLGRFSQGKEFMTAYKADIEKLGSDDAHDIDEFIRRYKRIKIKPENMSRENKILLRQTAAEAISYYLPKPFSDNPVSFSSEEAFAEIFAALSFPNGTEYHNISNDILKALLPNTFKVMEKVLEKFEYTMDEIMTASNHPRRSVAYSEKNIA